MRFPLLKQVALTRDIPEDGLKKGDLAMVVDYHPGPAASKATSYQLDGAGIVKDSSSPLSPSTVTRCRLTPVLPCSIAIARPPVERLLPRRAS